MAENPAPKGGFLNMKRGMNASAVIQAFIEAYTAYGTKWSSNYKAKLEAYKNNKQKQTQAEQRLKLWYDVLAPEAYRISEVYDELRSRFKRLKREQGLM